MKAFKSPCLNHPKNNWLPCKYASQDKNFEPCDTCDAVKQYDDMISFGIKRFADQRGYRHQDSIAHQKLQTMAIEYGYITVGDMIDAMIDKCQSEIMNAGSVDVLKR